MNKLSRLWFLLFTCVCLTGYFGARAAEAPINKDLQAALQQANAAGKLLLVDFYGSWCPWCVKMDSTLEDARIKAIMAKQFSYCKLDVGRFDKHTTCLQQYDVKGIPLLLVFNRDGSVRATCSGYKPVNDFTTFLTQARQAIPSAGAINPDLRAALQQANASGKLLLVDFYGSWCPWCVKMDATLEDAGVKALVTQHFSYDKVDVGRFNQHKSCLTQYNVKGIPLLLVFNPDGSVRKRCEGYMSAADFTAFLTQALATQQ